MKGSKNFLFKGKPGVAKPNKPSPKTANAKGQQPRTSKSPPKGQQPTAVRIAKGHTSSKQDRSRPI